MRLGRDGFSIEAAMAKGRELPEWFTEAPLFQEGDDFWFQAFWDLHTTRHLGFGMGPIPWNHIVEYGLVEQLDYDMIRALVRIIRAMDHAYLEWMGAQADRDRETGTGTDGRTIGSKTKTPKTA